MSQAAAQQPSRKKAVISLLVLLALTCIIVFTFKDHWAEITAALAQLSVWQVLAVLAVGILAAVKIRTKRKTGSWRGRRNDP